MLDFELSFSFVSGTELRFSGDFKNASLWYLKFENR
jgi:hypothetical protein